MTTPPSPPSPPSEVAALAARHQLGPLEGAFAPKRLGIPMFVIYLNVLVTFSAFFLVPGLLYFWWLRRFPNFSRKQAAKRLYLFEHGLIVQPRLGEGMTAFRWDSVKLRQDITQLFVDGAPTPIKYVYSVTATGFGGAEITEFYEKPETWGPWMQDAVLRAQGQTALDTIQEGGAVDFGTLSLSRAGMAATGKGRLPWSEIQEILVRGGNVHVMRSGASAPWSTVPVSGIANLHLLLAIAGNLCRR